MDSSEALIALNLIEHVGPVRARSAARTFRRRAQNSRRLQIRPAPRPQHRRRNRRGDCQLGENPLTLPGELKRIAESGCRVLIQSDDEYPALLREIYDPPMVLYVKGGLTAKDKNAVAMVGSRMTTHYGIETARKLAYQLAYVGVTVVSGGARGIDTAAHQGALAAKGRTVVRARHGHQYRVPAGEPGFV